MSNVSVRILSAVIVVWSTSAIADSPNAIYNSIPDKLPDNVASYGLEAAAFKELGDAVVFTPGVGGAVDSVKFVLSSWGCASGRWYQNDCATPANAKFKHPITLNIYAVATDGPNGLKKGDLLYTSTQTFDIPYRPSVDTSRCTSGRWYSTRDKTCYNGITKQIEFKLPNKSVPVPDKAIITLAYNSSHYGYNPIGQSAACYSTSGGCPYDSLNIAVDGNGGPVGAAADPNGVFINYAFPSYYCAPHVYEGDVVQIDTSSDPNCSWAGFHPQIEVKAMQRKQVKAAAKARNRP